MRFLIALAGCCVAAILLCACPARQDTTGKTSTVRADKPVGEDHVLESLVSEEPDIRNFALLAIVNFELPGYRDPVLELAKTDPVAAITAAAIYKEIQPTLDYYSTAAPKVRTDTILGVVFGLECADRIPPALWNGLVAMAPAEEIDQLLWGIAQLDVEPGGPIQRDAELIANFENRWVAAREEGSIYFQGALDALLGHDANHDLDWAAYTDYVTQSNWNGTQWFSLLRWADTATWKAVLDTKGANDRIRYQLARAVALAGPEDVLLPGGIGPWAGIDADMEYRVNQYLGGASKEIELPELDVIIQQVEQAPEGTTLTEADLNRRALSDVLTVLDYSLIHGYEENLTLVVDAMPVLPGGVRSAVMASIMRRNPRALSGENLAKVIALEDREVAYFLLSGWYWDEQVRQSDVPETVKMFTGSGNLVVYSAYERWLAARANSSDT